MKKMKKICVCEQNFGIRWKELDFSLYHSFHLPSHFSLSFSPHSAIHFPLLTLPNTFASRYHPLAAGMICFCWSKKHFNSDAVICSHSFHQVEMERISYTTNIVFTRQWNVEEKRWKTAIKTIKNLKLKQICIKSGILFKHLLPRPPPSPP